MKPPPLYGGNDVTHKGFSNTCDRPFPNRYAFLKIYCFSIVDLTQLFHDPVIHTSAVLKEGNLSLGIEIELFWVQTETYFSFSIGFIEKTP